MSRFDPNAFDDWLADASPIRFLVNHHGAHKIPVCGPISWEKHFVGLKASFEIDISRPRGFGAFLAVRHGFLNACSIGATINRSRDRLDKDGMRRVTTSATPTEVSFTHAPACPGTWIHIVGDKQPTSRTHPENDIDRDALLNFLLEVGISNTPSPVYLTAFQRAERDRELKIAASISEQLLRAKPGAVTRISY